MARRILEAIGGPDRRGHPPLSALSCVATAAVVALILILPASTIGPTFEGAA